MIKIISNEIWSVKIHKYKNILFSQIPFVSKNTIIYSFSLERLICSWYNMLCVCGYMLACGCVIERVVYVCEREWDRDYLSMQTQNLSVNQDY